MVFLTSAMFVLGTTQVALSVALAVLMLELLRLDVEGNFWLHTSLVANRIVFAQDILLITNNALTDGILIRRCYVVCGKRKLVIVLPTIMVVATTILGYVSAVQWASLEVRRTLQESGDILNLKDYNTAAAMCLESSAIYSIFVIAFIITGSIPTTKSSWISVINTLLSGGLPHVVYGSVSFAW
ncbi:hypothetical protein K438DRAFT_1750162 [Mycena galopus ATCC 62051]|nr:hypothetical protein K438DRAFT_1750162 [Mycena galopus ATCC 62051]